jgi:hypothetical protein
VVRIPRCEFGLLLGCVRNLGGLLLGFWVMGPEMPRVRAVGKECGLEAHRTERNIEGSDLARITGSSYCNQDGVHCRSDMRQSSFC